MLKFETGIQFLRLRSGEDIVSNISLVEEDEITLERPIRLVSTPTQPLFWLEWINGQFVKEKIFSIRKRDIVTIAEPSENLFKTYNYCMKKLEAYDQEREGRWQEYETESDDEITTVPIDSDEYDLTNDENFYNLEDLSEDEKKDVENFVMRQLDNIKKNGGKLN